MSIDLPALTSPSLLENMLDDAINGKYLLASLVNPTTVIVPASAGAILIQIASNHAVGTQNVKVWQKLDNGPTLNWIQIGSGASALINLEEAGVPVVGGPFSTLNFLNNATIVDAGGGKADITIVSDGLSFLQTHVITAPELAAKQFTLAVSNSGQPVTAWAQGSGPFITGLDFSVAGNIFSWNGLGIDGIIAVGDRIQVQW